MKQLLLLAPLLVLPLTACGVDTPQEAKKRTVITHYDNGVTCYVVTSRNGNVRGISCLKDH